LSQQSATASQSENAIETPASAPAAPLPLARRDTGRTTVVPLAIPSQPRSRRWLRIATVALAIVLGAAAGAFYWWQQSLNQLPVGIVWSNGRLEADEIDISTKFAGRIADLLVDEGSVLSAGQVVARMDTRDLEASLARAQAQAEQAREAIDEAHATARQAQTQVALAKQEFDRTTYLVQRGNATQELLDQRRQQLEGATAALTAATARAGQAEHALEAIEHDIDLYRINIADNTLVAPRAGRVQYRIANVGEVLSAGGKVVTMIDTGSVYMDIFLPTLPAGRAKIGSDARIVLDAYPDRPTAARVSFIATQSQFTPKTVETKSERDRLMFRVRVRIDADVLREHADTVQSGVPGIAYVRLDPDVAWPSWLQGGRGQ
jgi:HlyD family secretion protein